MKFRDKGVIGRPVHQHVEDAIRYAEFRDRMDAVNDALRWFVWPVVLGIGGVLTAHMLCGFVVAIVTQRGPA